MPSQNAPQLSRPNLGRAERLVMKMMAIPGKSGEEAAIVEFLLDQLATAGLPKNAVRFDSAHKKSLLRGEVGNMIVKLPGGTRTPRRMLSAHLDTVPICVGSQPKRKGQIVRSAKPGTGLGADNRAGCAVLLSTVLDLLQQDTSHPPLTFCWFVQEEIGLQGSRCATRSLWGDPKLAFNWDGGSPYKMTIGATGGYRLEIEIAGIASHAGNAPEDGVSAIAVAALAIADLHQKGWHGDIRKDGKHGTSNVGVIEGGAATNVVTDHVRVRAEARSHDPKFRRRILKELENAFRRAAKVVKNRSGKTGSVRVESRLDYESFLIPPNSPCVEIAEAAVRSIGKEPVHAVANGGVDANWMTAHGVPTVSLGCGQRNQHMVTEALHLDEFRDACRIAWQLACGAAASA